MRQIESRLDSDDGIRLDPTMHHHYAYTGYKPVVIDLTGYGPFQLYDVNPVNEPSKQTAVGD